MKKAIFHGAATALVTPFNNGEIDMDCMNQLIDRQHEGGISALVIGGTTGEGAVLSANEKIRLYNESIDYCAGRMKMICGIGHNNTREALTLAKHAELAGADAVMLSTPYYNKATQAGLVKHFFYVADSIGIPVIVYNVPSRTGVGIQPATYQKLSEHPNINGVKEASGNISEYAKSKALCGDAMNFWSGNDADTTAMMALGAKGVISVASNILPDLVVELCQLCADNDFPAAAALNDRCCRFFSDLFLEVNPIPVKSAIAALGLCREEFRLPLCPMTANNLNTLLASLRSLSE